MVTNLDQLVDPSHSDFTIRFLLRQLASADQLGPSGTDAVLRADAQLLDSGGFLSDIYRLRVHFAPTADRPPFSCIFKVPTSRKINAQVGYDKEAFAESMRWMFGVHNAECRFYSTVAPLLGANPAVPLPFRLPTLYACRECPAPNSIAGGYLLMEDVGGEDIVGVELMDGLSREQTESAIRALATYHALSLSLPRPLVDSFSLTTDLDFEDQPLRITERLMAMPDVAEQFRGQKEALSALYAEGGRFPADQHKLFGLAPVIVHGDFWLNNMLFKKTSENDKGANQLHALIDWQVCHSGTGVTDLLRLLFTCVDPELRRAHLDQWLCLYCSELGSALARLGLSSALGIPRPLPLIRRMALHHAPIEICFMIFLFSNFLGIEKDPKRRQKLIGRMHALFWDFKDGTLLPGSANANNGG